MDVASVTSPIGLLTAILNHLVETILYYINGQSMCDVTHWFVEICYELSSLPLQAQPSLLRM